LAWFVLLSALIGLVSMLDPLIFNYTAFILNASSLYLGIISALWSVVYIATSMMLNSLADRGHNKTLLALSTLMLVGSFIFIRIPSYTSIAISYVLHGASAAMLNLAVSVTLLEHFESTSWSSAVRAQRVVSLLTRAFGLIAVAQLGGARILSEVFLGIIALSAAAALLTPIIVPPHERLLLRLERSLSRVGVYTTHSSILLLNGGSALSVFSSFWSGRETISTTRILASVFLLRALDEYILTVLPVIAKRFINVSGMWIATGAAAIVTAILSAITPSIASTSRVTAIVLALTRAVAVFFGLGYVRDLSTLIMYRVALSTFNMLIDLLLYNMFVNASYGYGSGAYFSAGEMGSIFGSVLAGAVYGYLGSEPFYIGALLLGLALPAVLL